MNRKRNIGFTKPPEPSFITRLKQQAGYKEGPTVDTKRGGASSVEDDFVDDRGDDEAPTVVVLEDGHLTAEQAAVEMKRVGPHADKDTEEEPPPGSRIMFRKPEKRRAEGEDDAPPTKDASSKSARHDDKGKDKSKSKGKHKKKPLLSFDQDDEEQD